MRKKETYKSLNSKDKELETVECELCGKIIESDLIEISNSSDSTILCDKCAGKFNGLSSIYDD